MFRIESYITPIILSYVDKYIKNIRPRDSQMSLWGGAVSFQNLDMRLDVLEEELQLPFSFLSGHIHELTIRVPWTKIASESISITINTIEFVLKLKDNDCNSTGNSNRVKKVSRAEDAQVPTGYMASLVNKIANNISINCHNIIFKYVEEDIVMSMNIQLLSINSADLNWNPAFVDVSLIKVILRKIITISDLTICLDKRNETGKIDMCQEPILYRCSMKLKLLRRYNVGSAHKSSFLKADLNCDSIKLNISSAQFPMMMRLLILMYTLKEGKLKNRQLNVSNAGDLNEAGLDEDGESIFSWAWNLLPSIFPTDEPSEVGEEVNGHKIVHIGCFIDEFEAVLKDQRTCSDTIVNSAKKFKYNPILKLQLSGLDFSSISIGNRWFNMRGGVKSIALTPCKTCVCGIRQSLDHFIISSASPNTIPQVPDTIRSMDLANEYKIDWDDYFATNSDQLLKSQPGAIKFDICHLVDIPDDSTVRSSDFGSDLELSGLSEKYLMRVCFDQIQVQIGPNLNHILDAIKSYVSSYNYPNYVENKPCPAYNQLPPPSNEDYEALMEEVPLQKYRFHFSDLKLEFKVNDHYIENSTNLKFVTNVEDSVIHLEKPSYFNRLVFTTCQLPQPPMKLFNFCHINYKIQFKNVEIKLNSLNLMKIPLGDGHFQQIIYPHLWQDENILNLNTEIYIPTLELINLSIPLLHYLIQVFNDSFNFYSLPSPDILSSTIPVLHFTLQNFCIKSFETKSTKLYQLNMDSITGFCNNQITKKKILSAKEAINERQIIDVIYQYSSNKEGINPNVIKVHLEELELSLDQVLIDYLSYNFEIHFKIAEDLIIAQDQIQLQEPVKKVESSERNTPRNSIKILESVHSSSDRNVTITPMKPEIKEKKKMSFLEIYDLLCHTLVSVDIKGVHIFSRELGNTNPKTNFVAIRLPNINVQTSIGKIGDLKRLVPFSNESLGIGEKAKDFFPWTINLSNMESQVQVNGKLHKVIESFQTNITFAVSQKAEESTQNEAPFEIVLHVDTTPMKFNVQESSIVYLFLTLQNYSEIGFLKKYFNSPNPPGPKNSLEIANRPISPDSNLNLKEFFDIKTTQSTKIDKDNSSENTEANDDKSSTKLSIWMQWTFTKFNLNLKNVNSSSKFAIDVEDIILSWDQRLMYSKVKIKVGTLAGQLFKKDSNDGKWIKGNNLGFCGKSYDLLDKSAGDTFMDLTITKAETGVVHTKWGVVNKRSRYLNSNLMEIMVKMQQVDLKVDHKDLMEFMDILNVLHVFNNPKNNVDNSIISVADLPLIYFQSKGFRLFIPTETKCNDCSVFILKIGDIHISPSVENPLTRNPIRADIYTKATQLRILNLPGSKIEDRQYELCLKNITLGTGNWTEVLSFMDNTDHGSIVYNENPAFVWNNQTKKTTVDISAIFKDFNCSIVLAPAIVFNNILVSGQSLEFNCLSDLVLNINTNQILGILKLQKDLDKLSNRKMNLKVLKEISKKLNNKEMIYKIANLQKRKASKFISKLNSTSSTSVKTEKESKVADSGLGSSKESDKKFLNDKEQNQIDINVPYEVSFVGGMFTVNLYESLRHPETQAPHRKSLASMTFWQPNFLQTQGLYEKCIQMSLYNLKVGLSETDKEGEFNEDLFSTYQGKLNALGIPPSIFKMKYQENIVKEKSMTINLCRPMSLYLTTRNVTKLLSYLKATQKGLEVLSEDNKNELEENFLKPKDIISTFRKLMLECCKMSISISRFDLHCCDDESNKLVWNVSHFGTNLMVMERPERLHINTSWKAVSIKINDVYTLLHPTPLNLNIILSKEFWQKNPVIKLTSNLNFIQLDIGPCTILPAGKIMEALQSLVQTETCQKEIKSKPEMNSEIIQFHPIYEAKQTLEELYQDDLRAGAFQYVELASDKKLPMPYQIQIINKDVGVICWRYPQPRAMHRIEVYPVPFPIVGSAKVLCYLEYYCETAMEFQQFCEFQLSETKTSILNLPKKVTASIWRVVMTSPMVSVDGNYFEEESSSIEEDLSTKSSVPVIYNIDDILRKSEDEEEITKTENNTCLHPKILIACMKVDSYFSPSLISNFNAFVDIGYVEINMIIHSKEELVTLPTIIQKYKPQNNVPVAHHLGQIKINNLKINSAIYDDCRMTIQNELRLEMNLIDYSYLIFQPIIEDFKFTSHIEVSEDNNKSINVLVPSPVRLRITPSSVHSLEVMKNLWMQSLSENTTELIIMTRFIVCNLTNKSLHYGQSGTDELISLQSLGFDLYAFRSYKKEQSLTFSMELDNDRMTSEPCFVNKDGEQYLKFGETYLIAAIKKISSTQRKITIRGQLEIYNLSREIFFIEIIQQDLKMEMDLKRHRSITSEKCFLEENFIRIRFENGGWTGDIPIRPSGKKMPWLVKVPIGKAKYLSYWIKVIRKPVESFERFAIVILPLYFVQSHMAKDSLVEEINSGKKFEVLGKGHLTELYLPGTHEEDHLLNFAEPFQTSSGQNLTQILLSYKSVDNSKVFPVLNEDDIKFDQLIKDLENFSFDGQSWPSKEESNVIRKTTFLEQTRPIYDFGSLSKDSIYNTLILEVSPWCIFINSLEFPIELTTKDSHMRILPNQIGMPFEITENFQILVEWKPDHNIQSEPISLVQSNQGSKKGLFLTEDKFLQFDMIDQNTKILLKLNISLTKENNMKIITVSSQFVIVNLTEYNLNVFAFNVPIGNDKNLFFDKNLFQNTDNGLYGIIKQEKAIGYSVSAFNNEFSIKRKSNKKGSNLYITLEYEDTHSCPINISEAIFRQCVCLAPKGQDCISVAVSIIKHKDCSYVALNLDACPDLKVTNSTDCCFYIAQSDSGGNPVRECDQFHWYDVVSPQQTISYNPPGIQKQFPELVSGEYSLVFALCHVENSSLKWSEPVKVNESRNVFLSIPNKGDFKVTVDTEYKTKRIYIDYISQHLEFSARDIRTRLLNPVTNTEEEELLQNRKKSTIKPEEDHLPLSSVPTVSWNVCIKEMSIILLKENDDRMNEKIEVMSLTVDNLLSNYNPSSRQLHLSMQNIQIDNQLHPSGDFDFPVLVCKDNINSDDHGNETPFLVTLEEYIQRNSNGLLEMEFQFYKNEFEIKNVVCKLRPVRVYLEDTFASKVLDILLECIPENATYTSQVKEKPITLEPSLRVIPHEVMTDALSLSNPIKMDSLKIESIQVLLSVHTRVRLYIALDHSPLTFSAFEKKNVNTLMMKLGSSIGMHYLSGAIFGAGWVVGSLEILGSPSGLARSVSTGLKDFVSKPVEGLLKGPWDFVIGVTSGSASLVRNITAGTVNSVTKLATSVARNLDILTLDQEHVQRTDAIRRHRTHGGITQGLTDFGITLLGAIGGIARHTLEAKTPGQVLSGVGKGIMGVILKPISGAAELVALTGQGVLQSVGYNTLPSCRALALNNSLFYPSTTKFAWKIQQLFYNNNPILFSTTVTLINNDLLSPMFIGFSQNLIILFDLTTDEIIDVLQLDKIHPHLDNSDSTIVHLRILSKMIVNEHNEEIVNFHQIASRVREYIQSSREQLPLQNNSDLDCSTLDLNDTTIEDGLFVAKTISFYVHSTFSQHIVDYINMIKLNM